MWKHSPVLKKNITNRCDLVFAIKIFVSNTEPIIIWNEKQTEIH